MNWDTDLVGGEISEAATTAWNVEQAQIQQALAERNRYAGEDPTEGLTPEQIRELHNRSVAAQAQKEVPRRQVEAVRQFCAERPDYVTSQRNNFRVTSWLEASGLDATTPDHFHRAVEALASHGLLQLDPSRVPVKPRPIIDPETLSLDELRDAANAELQNPGKTRLR